MKLKQTLTIIFFLFLCSTPIIAQEVKNINVTQEGTRVKITYVLTGNKTCKVELFVTIDEGKTWKGPLISVSGDAGNDVTPGNNKQIMLDISSEKGLSNGYMQFKVEAETMPKTLAKQSSITDGRLKKYSTIKRISLSTAIASAGVGLFAYLQGNKLYDDYQTVTNDAADLHSKIETYDIIYPIAFALAGASTIVFAVYTGKHKKLKNQLSFQPMPLRNGGGLLLTYKF